MSDERNFDFDTEEEERRRERRPISRQGQPLISDQLKIAIAVIGVIVGIAVMYYKSLPRYIAEGCDNIVHGDEVYCELHADESSGSDYRPTAATRRTTTTTRRTTATTRKPAAQTTTAKTTRQTARKTTVSTSDPYNAKDYYHPDDFYFDYEDDFYDYEDAEDYWEKHHG